MSRKNKAPEEAGSKRKKWNGIYASPEEIAAIKALAQESGLSTNEYVIRSTLRKSVTGRRDLVRIVRLLTEISRKLEEIAAPCRAAGLSEEALPALLALAEIEAHIRRIAESDSDGSDAAEGNAC
jgi:hypothetical protein